MRVRTRGWLALVLTGLLLVPATAQADAGSPGTHPGRSPHTAGGTRHTAGRAAHGPASTRKAERALERAQHLLRTPSGRARLGGTGTARRTGRDATLALRDLALRLDDLSGADRRAARRLLLRPTDDATDPKGSAKYRAPEQYDCTEHFCVHWVSTTADAPPAADSDGDGVPDQVATTQSVLEHVWRSIVVDLGYRTPKSDEDSTDPGPDGRVDVYLADVGVNGVYGYCTSDDPGQVRRFDVSAFCVLDDDFSSDQFGATPMSALRVTAAHEFFHAVQFSYDWAEDPWLTEGTAAWVEDEVYSSINDNRQYLKISSLVRPDLPLDAQLYGAWVFWRYLSELFGTPGQPDPTVIRDVWEAADAAPGAPDLSSLGAVKRVAAARGVPFRDLLAGFAVVNRHARRWYDEGRHYPNAPLTARHRLSRSTPSTGRQGVGLAHLSNGYVRFVPTRSLAGAWHLRLALDLPDRVRGSVASVVVHRRGGGEHVTRVRLNRHGNARVLTRFNQRRVTWVELDLSNASNRFLCWQGTGLACSGFSLDDDLPFRYSARAVR